MSLALDQTWHVSRVIKLGRALYVGVTAGAAAQAGIKRGDRLGVTVEGRTLIMERIPFEELATLARAHRKRALDTER